jgi:hypothetical protein
MTLDVPEPVGAERDRVPLMAFGWIGQRHRPAGQPAEPATVAWWRRLQRWVAGLGVAVQRLGMPRGRGSTAFALPDAQQLLALGVPGDLNPPAF